MEQLQDALEGFGWTQYEAACYSALVRFGAMKASRVSSETGIMQSKIYQPLNQLEDKGYVKIVDKDPKVYDAQNPQYVMELEQQRFEDESQEVLDTLQEAWEIQEELDGDTDNAWIVRGRDGSIMEISRLVDDVENTLTAFDNRFARLPRDVVDTLESRIDDGVVIQLVSGSQALPRLQRLQSAGADVRELTELSRTSFYIADDSTVLLRLAGDGETVVVHDDDLATIITQEFEALHNEGSEVGTTHD